MVSKKNIKMIEEKSRDEKQRFSIRKLSVGAASVLIGLAFTVYGGQTVQADTTEASQVTTAQENNEETGNEKSENTVLDNSNDIENSATTASKTPSSSVEEKAPSITIDASSSLKNKNDNIEVKDDNAKVNKTMQSSSVDKANNVTSNEKTESQQAVNTKEDNPTKSEDTEKVNSTAINVGSNENTEAASAQQTNNFEVDKGTTFATNEKTEANSTNVSENVDTIEVPSNELTTDTLNISKKTASANATNAVYTMKTVTSNAANDVNKNKLRSTTMILAAEVEDPNAVTVSDAKGFINAIQNGTATTINVENNINLADVNDSQNLKYNIKHKRNILIQSNPDTHYTIDFSGNYFDMSTQNSVTFKDLNLYERSYWGIVYNAGGYTFDNVNFTGSQLIYTKPSINSTVTFKNNVTATAVGSYTGPVDGKSRSSQGGNTQQILQFEGGTNHIIFDENSNVTLTTTNSNVLEIDRGTTVIDVKSNPDGSNGAQVTLNPHTKNNPEEINSMSINGIARGIASNGNTTLNIDKGANLNINLKDDADDKYHSGALYLNSGATINNNGNLTITSEGVPYYKANGWDDPVYINGDATINVGNGATFSLEATNLGDFKGHLMTVSGTGTVKLDPHSNFKISGDGTGAITAINLSSGSTFTSDQPNSFTIDLSKNTSTGKSLIKNGTINFSRVKTVTDGSESQPLGKIDVTYDKNGNVTDYLITAQDENTVKQVANGLANKSLINLVQAGEDVTLSNLHLSKNNVLTGTVASSGSNNPIYVTVTVGGVSTNVPVVGNYTVYTNTKGKVTSDNVDYAAQTASTGGNFSIDLSKLASSLTDDAKVAVTATKDFVEAAQNESVVALRALNTTTLQELVDAAPAEEAKPSYYNATAEAQKAYTDVISSGQTILANPNNYDQVDVDNAVTAIQNAQKALTGESTNKIDLQKAVDDASVVESSDNYTNSDTKLQDDYQAAIKAGQGVLSKENATQTEVNAALTTINNAKDALNGDTKKAASKESLQKAVNEAPTVKSDDAAYYNGSDEAKAAYDNAITAGQKVLDDSAATATQITDALNAINIAKGNLKGEATDKSALQKTVDNSVTVKDSNNYTNADKTQKTAYDNAVTSAQTVLDKTNATQAEVNQALQDLETANSNLNGDAKTEAANKAALEAAVKDAPNVRDTPAYYNGSDEAQTTYNNAINAGQKVLEQANPSANDVKTALDAINAAKDNLKGVATNTEALETALTNANDAKATGNYTNADQANQEVLNNAITAGQEILKNTKVTQAEVDSAAKAITDAISGLNGDTNLTNAKNAATEDIQKALDTKTTEITDATNIDQATKDQLIADAKKAAEDANTAINQATDANAVNTAKTEGITNINNVTVPSLDDAKTKAAKEIDQALTDKTKEITDAENIDQTTKDQLIKEATDAANTAKDAVEKATTNNDVATEQSKGIDAISNVKVPSVTDSQNAAKDAIDDALNAKTKEINNANNIDQAIKDQLIKEATDAANNAKEAIDQATTADAIKTAQDEGTTNINNVTVPSLEDAKKAANKAVDDALTAQTEVINKADNLSDTEKKDLIDQATAEATTAKDAIEKATTNNEAAQAGQAGVDAINKIVPTSLDTVKSDANKAIEEALTKKLEEINSSNDLTTDEKTALTQEANTAADKAKEEITKATTNDAVIEAQTNGVSAIDGIKVPTESVVKEAAKKAVADAATAKNNAIDASNLTDEEKVALKQKVTEAQNSADQAIDNATTNAAVTEAQTNGVNAIDGIEVPTTSATKEQATTDLNTAVDDAKKAIDQDNNLTDEQKQAAKDQIDSDAKTAQEAINNAKTNDDVKKATDDGTLTIDKDVANAAIDNAVAGKKNEISKSSLTDDEKTALNNKVDQKAQDAKDIINNATTPEAVTSAQESGIKNITDTEVPSESAAKQAAKEAVAKAADDKNAAIDSSNLTDEEKAALKQEVADAQNAANTAIDNTTTNTAVTEAEDKGVRVINGIEVPNKSDAKEKAVTDLNTAVENAKKAIDQDNNLTDEQKQTAKDQIDSDAKTAQETIDSAKTNDDVKKAAADGTLVIDKDVANAAIDNAVAGKKAEISNSPLTNEEKTALTNEVDQKAQDAKEAINTATTPEAVTNAQENGIKNINDIDVPSESAAKQSAKEAVAKVADEKNATIDASNLTDEEKAALKQEVSDAQSAADQAIDNATTNADVTEAKDNGISAIDGIEVPTTSANKEKAVTDLNTAAENAKKAIDQDSNLTDEQKQAAKDQIDSDAKTAQETIDNAKTNDDVKKAAADGTLVIDKDVANAAIDNAVAGKLKEIQDPLTTEEKQAYTDLINSEANNAKQNIANATTVEEVTTAQTNGVNEINNTKIPTTSSAKDKAIAAINDALQKKTDEINNASNINTKEKTDLINQANEAADTAKNNINNATTNADVDTAQTNGEKAIAGVTVPNLSDVKKESINLINKALDAKTDEINNASNLSQDEKQSLINDATDIATEAINNVNQSQIDDDAKAAATTGVQNIENVTIPTLDEAKKNANQAIDDALNSKVNEINNASNLNDTEKQKLVDQATEAATTAKNNVENATTNDAARDAANAGINNIKGITFTSLEDAKNAANTAIDNALQVKTDKINNASNLSTDEKQDLINQATEVAKNAKDNINNTTTNDAVTEAQNKGIGDIANVTVPSLDQVKQDAINAIKQVQDAKNKQISAASNLSAEEQKALTDQVDKIANDAIGQINDSSTTTNDAVSATRDDAIKQITDLFIPTLDGAQTDALNAIESAKNAKLNDINNATHLTDQEKQALVDQTDKAADDATKEIKVAQTNDAVKSAETAGLDNINNITIPTLVQKQQEAIEELNAARDAKNIAIDDATDLTTDEKNALKDKVQAEYSNAVSNITSATTDEAVTTAKENGINAIKDIEIPTKSPAKDQATTDLNDAVDEAKKAIDQDNNLTDAEKQAAKDQIDSDAKKAQEAIDNAKTDDEVKTAVDNGQLAIDKDVANAAIDNAVAGKKAEIAKAPLTTDEAKDLNDLVDQEAKAAKKAIDSATTIPAVDDAKNTGVAAINNIAVPTTSSTKDQANQTIDDALANKTKEINDATNLSDKQKQDLIDQANEEAAKAKKNIKNATSNEAVNKATTDGVDAIANVTVPSLDDAKKDASQLIDDVLKQKEDEINNASHLTDQEKQDLIDQAQNAADEAKDKINQATTNDDVATERDAGAEKIANIVVPSLEDAKDKATKAIDDALADKTKEINDQTNLSDQEKNDLINQITDIADKAKDKINNAATDADIAKNEKDGIDAIVDTKIPGLEDHKKNAINSLDEAKSTKLAQIDGATHLTANEKTDLTQQVDAEYNKALDEINKATTNDDADKASADGVEAILNIKVPSLNEKKQDSINALNEVRDAKKDEINKATNLNQNEKDELNKQVDQIADKAINAINEANDDQTAKNAENKGIQDILDVKVPSLDEVKNNAKQAIADALESKQNEINKAVNLDQSTKQDLINQAKTAAENANKNIDLATTNDEVIAASKKGVQNIENIIVPAPSTNSDTSNISTDQTDSDANKSQAQDSNKTSNNDINKNTDNPKHSKSGKSSVSLDDKKNQAINELTKVAEAKKAAINSTNISADAKARLNAQVDRELARGKNSISQARNSEELTSSKNTAIATINSISVAPKGTQGVNSRENHGNTDLNNNSITVGERPISHIPTSDKQETLPQTGHHTNEGLTILGTLVAGVAGLITLAGTKKRKD
ncbi:YSIRK signal domain/LPXTG anchor domain surface protein [Lactobacillus acidophilus]|uniref:DUF1542 domain-containing protein n=1 Tax=Lactobacillus acidophilus TaxID=1579 RepID=UPI000F751C53|nr:DUF1542 domain-containing protein [Lactobacillus acidophilus]AZN76100.1 YSIRK signal domain/LPXTG anchor domain surface protein [Lactobacillus acidophilus]